MRLVLLGAPGAGKGTLAQLMSRRFGVPQLASGDLLREAVRTQTVLGRDAQTYMQRGELVPDALVTALVLERLSALREFALDGFPRTEAQALELDGALASRQIPLDRVLYVKTSTDVIVSRLVGRRICRSCDAIYHVMNIRPARDGICDRCGGTLEQRQDDRPETVVQRLRVYEEQTAPLLEYYRTRGSLRMLDGDLAIEALFQSLVALFEREQLLPRPGRP